MDFGWPALGGRKGRAPKSPERASGMTLAVQVAGHWGSPASGSVSRRVKGQPCAELAVLGALSRFQKLKARSAGDWTLTSETL